MSEKIPISNGDKPLADSSTAEQYFINMANSFKYLNREDEPAVFHLSNTDDEKSQQFAALLNKFMVAYFGEYLHSSIDNKRVGILEADKFASKTVFVGKLYDAENILTNGSSYRRSVSENHGLYFVCTIKGEDIIENMTVAYNDGLGPLQGKSHVAYELNSHTGEFEKLAR